MDESMALIQRFLQIGEADQGFALLQFCPLEFPMLLRQTDRRLRIGQFRQPIDDAFRVAVGDVVEFFDEAVDETQIRGCQPGLFPSLSAILGNLREKTEVSLLPLGK